MALVGKDEIGRDCAGQTADERDVICAIKQNSVSLSLGCTMAGPVILLPYNFDWSGVISARYATPAPDIGVWFAWQRRYWGICRRPEEFVPVFNLFNDRRPAIYDLWRAQEGLEERRLDRSLEYFDEFYEIINDPGKLKRGMLMQCRDMSYVEGHVR